ncbi:MAG: heavy metal translocating P-type ATPase [Hyphomonadaceae bacterium]
MTAVKSGRPSGLSPAGGLALAQDPAAFMRERDGRKSLDILVRGASCGGCLAKIESAVARLPGVALARLNLSTGRLRVEWTGALRSRLVVEAITSLGYGASAFEPAKADEAGAKTERDLFTALTVAGVATAAIMFLSEPLWFGTDLPQETRTILRWISALVAIPAAAFAGQPFLSSALASIRSRRLNMDVPICLAVVSALGLSLFETINGGRHAFFDAAVMLLFFLLIGRILDARLRRQAYTAANALIAMQTATATRIGASGSTEAIRASDIRSGDMLLIAAGEQLAADVEIVTGESEADLRLVTGEIEPASCRPGQVLHAGSVNLSAPIRVRALARADQSLMADVARLLEAGEQKKSAYRKLADKAAEIYVPQVHATAALGFVGWLIFGATPAQALHVAITVLIITCPCALALAAPLVQVVAAGTLFRRGIYLTSGDALERLATVDHVIFDKTGTLTLGDPVLSDAPSRAGLGAAAAALARASHHPCSRALVRAAGPGPVASDVEEHPGQGVSALVDGRKARLGSAAFVGVPPGSGSELWYAVDGRAPEAMHFEDCLRSDAHDTVARLKRMGLGVELLSGDADVRVERAAVAAGIKQWRGGATPLIKARHLEALQASGMKVLMVGDGLNDAAALAGAHASIAPGGAVDVARLASDCVFSGDSLAAVVTIIEVARNARARMRENFAFAALYNILALPVALLGWVTPLIAALAMSGSSAVVTLNALRLSREPRKNAGAAP